jgi:hypothetical protein
VKSTFNRDPPPFGSNKPAQQAPKSSPCWLVRPAGLWRSACSSWCRDSRSFPLLGGPKASPDWRGYHASHRRPEGLWRSTLVPRLSPPARRLLRSGLALAVLPIARRRSAGSAIASAFLWSRGTSGKPWLPALSLDRRLPGPQETGLAPGCSRLTRRRHGSGPNDPLFASLAEASDAPSGMPPPLAESRRTR